MLTTKGLWGRPGCDRALLCSQLLEILAKTPYGHEQKGLFGIDQLLSEGVFRAAFPLHDVRPGGRRGRAGASGLDVG